MIGDRKKLKNVKNCKSAQLIDFTHYEASEQILPFLQNITNYQDHYQSGKLLG